MPFTPPVDMNIIICYYDDKRTIFTICYVSNRYADIYYFIVEG